MCRYPEAGPPGGGLRSPTRHPPETLEGCSPPLPLATATTASIPGKAALAPGPGCWAGAGAGSRSAVSTAVADKTPGTMRTASSQAWRTGSIASAAAGSISIAKPTLRSLITIPEIMPSATTSWPRPGSRICFRASRICCSVTCVMLEKHPISTIWCERRVRKSPTRPGRIRQATIYDTPRTLRKGAARP